MWNRADADRRPSSTVPAFRTFLAVPRGHPLPPRPTTGPSPTRPFPLPDGVSTCAEPITARQSLLLTFISDELRNRPHRVARARRYFDNDYQLLYPAVDPRCSVIRDLSHRLAIRVCSSPLLVHAYRYGARALSCLLVFRSHRVFVMMFAHSPTGTSPVPQTEIPS